VKSISVFTILVTALFVAAASAVDIQDAYDACGPGEGYDKYLELDPTETYTGWLVVDSGVDSCIAGNGATIQLDNGRTVRAMNSGTKMDIDHTVIYCNGTGWGISLMTGAQGNINFCTIDNCEYGVYVWGYSNVTLKNSIITNNNVYGFAKENIAPSYISYVNAWGNTQGNYYQYCAG
jgi:hypothetical protein